MSDYKQSEPHQPIRKEGELVDQGRRGFTRLGAGAPVLMTLASQPVFGINCLSNAMSGNLSDPNRGFCIKGSSVGMVASWPTWGMVDPDVVILSSTPLAAMTSVFDPVNDGPETLRFLINNGSSDQKIVLAAWANSMETVNYAITEDQFLELLSSPGMIPPGFPSLVTYLASTLSF